MHVSKPLIITRTVLCMLQLSCSTLVEEGPLGRATATSAQDNAAPADIACDPLSTEPLNLDDVCEPCFEGPADACAQTTLLLPFCSETGACVACTQDVQCGGGRCVDNSCVACTTTVFRNGVRVNSCPS